MKLGHAKILPQQEAPMAEMFRNWLLAWAGAYPNVTFAGDTPCTNVSKLVAGMKLGHAQILPLQEAPLAEMFRTWLVA